MRIIQFANALDIPQGYFVWPWIRSRWLSGLHTQTIDLATFVCLRFGMLCTYYIDSQYFLWVGYRALISSQNRILNSIQWCPLCIGYSISCKNDYYLFADDWEPYIQICCWEPSACIGSKRLQSEQKNILDDIRMSLSLILIGYPYEFLP